MANGGTIISLLPVGTATEAVGVAGASAPILQLRGGPVGATAISALGDARVIAGTDGLLYVSENGGAYVPLPTTASPWNNTTLAGFITENTVTDGVIVGDTVDGSAGTRKLQVQATGTKNGLRILSALATDNILDWYDTTLNAVGLSLTGQFLARADAAFTLKTTRAAAGAGDNVTVQGATAVATAPNTAFAGAQAALLAGDAAANLVAQSDGSPASIAAGSGASGVGGGSADGGNVFVATGNPGVNGGNPGKILLQSKGAAGVQTIPPVTNQGEIGTDTFRFLRMRASSVVAGDTTSTVSLNPPTGVGVAAFETWDGGTVPPVSAAGTARAYFDGVSLTLKVSYNGGAYIDLATGSASPWTRALTVVALSQTGDTEVNPFNDDTTAFGRIANRWSKVITSGATTNANGFFVYGGNADTQPTAQLAGQSAASGGFLNLGQGGAAAADTRVRRTGTKQLTMDDNAGGGIDVVPAADLQNKLGLSINAGDAVDLRWLKVTAQTITSGDIAFTDDGCPICGKEFVEGDDIVLRVIKTQKTKSGPLTTTVPAHHGCK